MDHHSHLRAMLPGLPPQSLSDIPVELRLFADDRISVFYAPFDALNPGARVIVLGLTPGWQQAQIAFTVASKA